MIAAVNGIAAGAGAVLAAAADIRVLAESASFRYLFTSVGISGGDMGICWLLPRIVGMGRATEILLLGGTITSHQAEAWGLASRVVPDAELDATVADYVVRFKHTGKSAGYGFVEMGSGEQALNAVVALEGTEWDGHLLRLYVTPYANQAV